MSDEPYSYDQGGTFPPIQPVRNGTGKPEPVYNNPTSSIKAGLRYIHERYGKKETE